MKTSGIGQVVVGSATGMSFWDSKQTMAEITQGRLVNFCNLGRGPDSSKECVSEKSVCGTAVANVPAGVDNYAG